MSKLSDYSKFDHIDSDSDEDENDVGGTSTRGSSHSPLATASLSLSPPTGTKAAATTPPPAAAAASSATPPAAPIIRGTTKKHPFIADRYVFSYNDQKVYEWEQSLEEVTIYINAPTAQLPKEHTASYIIVNILPNQLQVGLKGADKYFIDERTFDKVKVKESSWYLDEEGAITIILCKCFRGQTWEGVLCGHPAAIGAMADGNDATSSLSASVSGGTKQGIQESIDPFTKQEMQRTLMLERFQEENPGFDFRDATFNGEVPDPRTFMGGVSYNN